MDTVTIGTPTGPQTVPVPANVSVSCAPDAKWTKPGQYAVNTIDQMEAISQPLYSYQAYAAAGQTTLSFFVNPASGTTTVEDTNMVLAGQLPAPQKFLVQGIGVDYLPGTAASRFGAQSANGQLADAYAILRRGYLSFTIGAKQYLEMTTLMSLPPRSHIGGSVAIADTTTAGGNQQSYTSTGYSEGPVFCPRPLLLEASQNFRINMTWPGGAVAIPSGDTAARIGVWLYGTLYRSPQ